MLNWFRIKRKLFIPVITAVFIGGLFSLVCPHCLAKMVMDAEITNTAQGDNDHCSHMEPAKPVPVQSHLHCNGNCACEDHVMLAGSRPSAALSDDKGYTDFRMPAVSDLSWAELPFIELPFTVGRPYKPDRACFSPLERNCVLLN